MLEETLYHYKQYFADGAETELRAQRNEARRATFLCGQLVANSSSDYTGVSARVRKKGVSGFSSTGEYTDASVRRVLEEATSNAELLERHAKPIKGRLSGLSRGLRPMTESVGSVAQKMYLDTCGALDQYVVEHCPGITSRTIVATSDAVEKVIATSDGYDAHVVTPRSYVYIIMAAESNDGVPIEVFNVAGGYGSFDLNFNFLDEAKKVADKVYDDLMKKKEAVYTEAGVKTCILSGALAGMLAHEAVGHTVEADLVLGGSVAAHLMDQQVASERVTMVDFAHTALGEPAPLPVYVDDEGVLAEDAILIENGILRSYMHNRETADHFGTKSLGNARAWMYSDEPLIRMRNTAILPGKDTFSDMIASVDDGYYFVETNNGQADSTGEFMFGVTVGYEIKKGKLGRALHDTTISGLAFEMLKSVDMLSDEIEWVSSGFCGKKQRMPVGLGGPNVRCELTVGGR